MPMREWRAGLRFDAHRACYSEVSPRTGWILDDRLKELIHELGNAINESLSDSERIAAAIGEIKSAGYDVFLVLEATIGFNKRTEAMDEGEEGEALAETEGEPSSPQRFKAPGKIRWTSQDHKFLRALKISIEDEG